MNTFSDHCNEKVYNPNTYWQPFHLLFLYYQPEEHFLHQVKIVLGYLYLNAGLFPLTHFYFMSCTDTSMFTVMKFIIIIRQNYLSFFLHNMCVIVNKYLGKKFTISAHDIHRIDCKILHVKKQYKMGNISLTFHCFLIRSFNFCEGGQNLLNALGLLS